MLRLRRSSDVDVHEVAPTARYHAREVEGAVVGDVEAIVNGAKPVHVRKEDIAHVDPADAVVPGAQRPEIPASRLDVADDLELFDRRQRADAEPAVVVESPFS